MTTAPVAASFPAWEAQLAAQRGTLNQVLATARAAGASADVLRTAMRELGPPVEALLAVLDPPRAEVVCRSLTELVCDLVVRKAWHDRSAERWAVLSVLPGLPRAVGRSPRTTIEVVVLGAGRIARETDLGAWGARLAAADAHLSDDAALRAAAAVAAWRSGLVRVRRSALSAAATLVEADDLHAPDALRVLLGLDDSDDSPRDALADNAADPFSWPGAAGRGTVATYGGYRAFGGPWTGVPVVIEAMTSSTPTWRVLADGIPWVVVADVHGHVVLREPSGALPSATVAPSADLVRDVRAHVAWEDEVTGAAPAAAGAGASGARPVLVSRETSCRLDLVLLPATAREPVPVGGGYR
ncbi:hypothetical protein [Sanguibacter sp. 25GB23B1]|uniref:hypothetical protein n=1 Tax=unclassified Sanguibacter TaxID=2645534 RepID=UPI0032AF6BEA